jgi:hypothetical protein
MAVASHRIERVVIDLTLASAAPARGRAMQERISGFCRDRLAQVLEACLAGVDQPERALALDRIELDLGEVSADTCNDELGLRVERALAACLANLKLGGHLAGPTPALQALADFLGAGRASVAGDDADALVMAAWRAGPAALAAALRRWGASHACRVRLARALSAPVCAHLVRLLAGQQGQGINDYVDALSQLHRRRPLVPDSASDFDAVVWELVFTYLLVERGSHFNTQSFIGSHVRRLAARYRISYAAMLAQLTRCVAAFGTPGWSHADLGITLAELARAEPRGQRIEAAASDALAHEAALLRSLDMFLACGAWQGAVHARDSAAAALAQLLQGDPDGLCSLLRRRCTGEFSLQRLLAALDVGQAEALLHLLEPADGARIAAHSAALRLAHARQPLVAQAAAPFARTIGQLALRYLLASRGSRFNNRSFIKDVVRKLAARHGLRYDSLLFGLLAGTPAPGEAGEHGLADILLSLADEALLGVAPGAGAGNLGAGACDALAHWLVHGATPGPSADAAVRTASAESPRALAEVLRLGGRHAARRLAAALGEQGLHGVLDVLAGPAAAAIGDAVALLTLAHGRRPLPGWNAGAFARFLWTVIFELALVGPTAANPAALARRLAAGLARRQGMPVADAAHWLQAGLQAPAQGQRPLRSGAIARELAALALDAAPAQAEREQTPASPGPAAALTILLLHGVAPAGRDPHALLAWLAAIEDGVWREVLGHYGSREPVLRRLAQALGPAVRDTALRAAAGADLQRVQELIAVLAGACRQLGLARAIEVSATLHYCLLAYLLAGGARLRPRLGFRDLVLHVVQALAARYRKPSRVLLEHALEACAEASRLRPALRLAYHAHTAAGARAIAAVAAPIGPLAAQELTLHYLGADVFPAAAPRGAPEAVLEQLNSGALLAAGSRLVDALLAVADNEAARQRLLRNLAAPHRRALLRLLAPAYAGLLESLLLAGESGARRLDGITPATLLSWHWEHIVGVLLCKAAGAWQGRRLLGEIADRVARSLGLARGAYLAAMCEAARQQARAQQRFEPLHDLLAQLGRDSGGESAVPPAPAAGGVTTTACSALDALLRYGSAASAWDGHAADLVDAALEREPEALRQVVLEAARHVLERGRLARLLSEPQLQQILPGLLGQQYGAVSLCLYALREGHAALRGSRADAALYTEELWQQLHLRTGGAFSLPAYAGAAARRVRREHGVPEEALLARARQAIAGAAGHEQVSAALAQAAIECEQRELAGEHGLAALPLSALAAEVAEPIARVARVQRPQRPARPLPPVLAAVPVGQPFLVPNAGLVLLWQYLYPYLSALGLLHGRAFAGARQQHRAACLLQLLACGRMQAPEHALLLNKLLCGLEASVPVECDSEPTEHEMTLADQLLYSVTQHWRPMKNTSIEVLRASFLMRQGSLVREQNQWTLAVSAGPYDMLLQSLPWQVSTIRLPWMSDMLGVQWK